MKLKISRKPYRFLAILAISALIVCVRINCPLNTYSKRDIEEMKDAFITQSGGKRSLFPTVIGLGKRVVNIFAVPEKDAIGTVDIDNAISFLEFEHDKVKVKIIKKDFTDEASGDYYFSFLPVYSNDDISYAQSRWIVSQNLRTGENRTISVVTNLDDWIGKLGILDAPKKIFVVEILKGCAYENRSVYKKYLNIGTFAKDVFMPNAIVEGGIYDGLPGRPSDYHEPWTTYENKLFVYVDKEKAIHVFDSSGNRSTHPIQEIFSHNKTKFRRVEEILFHPILPFALILERGYFPDLNKLQKKRDNSEITWNEYKQMEDTLLNEATRNAIWLLRWDTPDSSKQLVPLLSKAGTLIPSLDSIKQCSEFQFSPDGKWLVFRDETRDHYNPVFIAIPVSKELPIFLGEPLFLGKVLRQGEGVEAEGAAWIGSPTSYVVTDGMVLYKWELANIDRARIINQ